MFEKRWEKKMMHKKIWLVLAGAFVLTISCERKSDACKCADTGYNLIKELKGVNYDQEKVIEIEKKYKDDLEFCDTKMKALTPLESEKFERDMRNCESFKKMMKETEALK